MPSGGGKSPTVTQASTLTPAQQGFLSQILGYAGKGMAGKTSGASGVQAYPGAQVAGATPLLQAGLASGESLLGGTNAIQNQALTAAGSLEQPFDPTQAQTNWQQAVQAPTMQNWNEKLLPQLQEQFAGANALDSGGSAVALGQAAGNLETGLASSEGNWMQNAQQMSAQQLLNAAGLTSQIPGQNITATEGLAGSEYGISQNQLTALMNKWLYQQPYNNPWLSVGGAQEGIQGVENIASPNAFQNVSQLLTSMGMGGMGLAKVLQAYGGSAAAGTGLTALGSAGGVSGDAATSLGMNLTSPLDLLGGAGAATVGTTGMADILPFLLSGMI